MKWFGGILIVLLAFGLVFILYQNFASAGPSGKKTWLGSAGLSAQQKAEIARYPAARSGAGHF